MFLGVPPRMYDGTPRNALEIPDLRNIEIGPVVLNVGAFRNGFELIFVNRIAPKFQKSLKKQRMCAGYT